MLKATLETTDEKVLNLNKNRDTDFVFEKFQELKNQFNIIFDENDEVKNRCMILDVIKEFCNIDIIIKTFETKHQSYGRVNIEFFEENYFPIGLNYNETQICAINNNCIKKSIELSKEGDYKHPDKIWFPKNKKR